MVLPVESLEFHETGVFACLRFSLSGPSQYCPARQNQTFLQKWHRGGLVMDGQLRRRILEMSTQLAFFVIESQCRRLCKGGHREACVYFSRSCPEEKEKLDAAGTFVDIERLTVEIGDDFFCSGRC